MKYINLTGLFFLISIVSAFGQAKQWNKLDDTNYTIKYPTDWELDKTGKMGTTFIIFSPIISGNDNFSENVTFAVQDLSAHNINLNQYVEISEKEISSLLTNGELISSKRLNKNGMEFQKLIYTGKQGSNNLRYEQFFWLENNNAYVLTFTCEKAEYSYYKEIVGEILNSFELNIN